jgi:antitoxin FitA
VGHAHAITDDIKKQEPAMGQILVRNIPDATLAMCKDLARSRGHSLEQEIRDLIEQHCRKLVDERVALARRIRDMTPPGPKTPAADLIREDRDR